MHARRLDVHMYMIRVTCIKQYTRSTRRERCLCVMQHVHVMESMRTFMGPDNTPLPHLAEHLPTRHTHLTQTSPTPHLRLTCASHTPHLRLRRAPSLHIKVPHTRDASQQTQAALLHSRGLPWRACQFTPSQDRQSAKKRQVSLPVPAQ